VAARGGARGVRDREQLDELLATAGTVDPGALRRFLDRLDRLMLAIEDYANPELVLDVLLLTWPRIATAASGLGVASAAASRPGRVSMA
jgi:hypothetical protein